MPALLSAPACFPLRLRLVTVVVFCEVGVLQLPWHRRWIDLGHRRLPLVFVILSLVRILLKLFELPFEIRDVYATFTALRRSSIRLDFCRPSSNLNFRVPSYGFPHYNLLSGHVKYSHALVRTIASST